MEPTQYIGITIGPVVKTIAITSSPGGMWGASYLFSYIAKSICQQLVKAETPKVSLPVENIISPYLELDQNNNIINQRPGVGLFHDRIIFKTTEHVNSARLVAIIEKVKTEVGEKLYDDLIKFNEVSDEQSEKDAVVAYVKAYLQIDFIETAIDGGENPLLTLSSQLDAMELQQGFVEREACNYFLKLFDNRIRNGRENDLETERNKKIKNCFLVDDFADPDPAKRFEKWPLTIGRKCSVATLEKIARGPSQKPLKRYKYYAIVQSDGDNMGEILKGFASPEAESEGPKMDDQIRGFSKTCFSYCQKAVDEIIASGGVPIYAGGDDLLFIAPVYSEEKGNIFRLLDKIETIFNKEFKDFKQHEPSLSFGVSVNYHKFPLYEAFNQALDLLFRVAKNSEGKNALAINFQKHSGQNFGYLIKKTSSSETYQAMQKLIELNWEEDEKSNAQEQQKKANIDETALKHKDDFLRSVAHKLKDFEELFIEAMKKPTNEALENLFDNLFDSEIHGNNQKYIDKVKEMMLMIKAMPEQKEALTENKDNLQIITIEAEKEDQTEHNQRLKTIDSILRTLKFYTEREGAQA